jgi:hypothetical protein
VESIYASVKNLILGSSNMMVYGDDGDSKWRRRNQPVQEFVINNFSLDRKIKEACKGLMPESQWLIKLELESDQDKELLADFILQWSDHGDGAMMSPNTKRVYVTALVYLSRYVRNVRNGGRIYKSFKEMTRDDFFAKEEPKGYLESLKRDFSDDPDKKWVSTHNTRLARYLAFWKWLTQPELKAEERQEPPQLKGYRFAKREAKTSVKREHLWTPEEHAVFLNRCEDLRLTCYHAIALDTGGRPGELLELKLGDIKVETVPSTGALHRQTLAFVLLNQLQILGKTARPLLFFGRYLG